MRRAFTLMLGCLLIPCFAAGCRSGRHETVESHARNERSKRDHGEPVSAQPVEVTEVRPESPAASNPTPANRPTKIQTAGNGSQASAASNNNPKFDAKTNPTTTDGRGDPSLDDKDRPAAWIFVDGQSGRFVEKAGQKLLQWMIGNPVGSKPTFRVAAFEPLMGSPRDFKCVLKTVESAEGSYIDYRIAASNGTFEVGRDYPLLRPGNNFTIRNAVSGDVVQEIGPLAPGTYAIAASIRNAESGKEASAVSYFSIVPGK